MTQSISRNTLTLRSSGLDIRTMAEMLEADFSKEQIKKILDSFDNLFSDYNVVTSTKILSTAIPEMTRKYTSVKKSELAQHLAILLSSQDCVTAYMNLMPLKALDIFRLVFRNIYVSIKACKDIFGRDIATKKKGWGYSYYNAPMEVDPLFSILKCETIGSWSTTVDYLIMPQSIRKAVGFYLRPEPLIVETFDEYTPGKNESLYDTQATIEPLYPLMHTLYINGILEMGKTKVTATTIKRISKQISFVEFFPDSDNKSEKILAATLATSLFCLCATNSLSGRKAIPNPPQEVARNIVKFIRNSTEKAIYFFAGIILNKVYQTMFSSAAMSMFMKSYLDTIKELAADKWLMMEGIENTMRNSDQFPEILMLVNPLQTGSYSVCNDYTGKYLAPFNIIQQLSVPMIHLITAALASLGILEVVYGDPSSGAASPFGSIKALKLTNLGKYAFEAAKEFTSSIAEAGPMFEFDSDRLLMRTLGENNPYEGIIKEYLSPVGDHRFTITPDTFLEGCSDVGDIERKTANFKNLVGDLPPVWDAFLDNLKRKCRNISNAKESFYILTVNPDDDELISLISSDQELRKYTVCAEGYILLVRIGYMEDFIRRMKHFGYLV